MKFEILKDENGKDLELPGELEEAKKKEVREMAKASAERMIAAKFAEWEEDEKIKN